MFLQLGNIYMIASHHMVAIFSVKEFVWIESLNFLCSNMKNASML